MNYEPKPKDTSKVLLSAEISKLTELLARNAHENWAAQRIKDGWKCGPARDDARKEHPGLVPYDDLSDSEKEYDRITAGETVKAIIALGFHIMPETKEAPGADHDQFANTLLIMLKSPTRFDLANLLSFWYTRSREGWQKHPEIYNLMAKRLLEIGEPLLACDVAREGQKVNPNHLQLNQLAALALARSGAVKSANKILQDLYNQGHNDEETLGLLARTHKDIWSGSKDPDEGQKHLEQALKLYLESYQTSGGSWPGINAATLALAAGQPELAIKLAGAVKELCLAIVNGKHPPESLYWEHATLGEACVILNQRDQAREWYTKAAKIAGDNYGDISASRRNLSLLLKCQNQPEKLAGEWLPLPNVAVLVDSQAGNHILTGRNDHLPDVFADKLKSGNIGIAYSGADKIGAAFIKSAQQLKAETHMVLPCRKDLLLDGLSGDETWRDEFKGILEKSTGVVTASEEIMEESQWSRIYADLLLNGLAVLRANHLHTKVMPLAVKSGQAGQGRLKGTIKTWERLGCTVEEISLGTEVAVCGVDDQAIEESKSKLAGDSGTVFNTRLVGLLFADAVGFSKLGERDIKKFIEHFWGAVSTLLADTKITPLMKNTWGDGLFMVFDSLKDAGSFALQLCDMVNATDWEAKGLPKDFNLRVALHAGPVYEVIDPITGIRNYLGSHVSKAARIEPITPPGQVYASQAFAALSAMGGFEDFSCEYVGQIPLAKGYGTFPMYHLIKV